MDFHQVTAKSIQVSVYGVGLLPSNSLAETVVKYFIIKIDDTTLSTLYIPTHTRAAPWLIGIVTGYVLFQCKQRVIKIHKVLVILLWLISCGIMLAIVLYHNRIGTMSDVSLLKASLFNSLARTVWTIAVSIIVFLCVTGYGSIINRFLSSAIFTVLIRVNYSMYLLHMVVILYDVAQKRTPDYAAPRSLFYVFWGDLVVTLMCSILWTLTFESPVLVLEKVLFGKRKPTTSNGTGPKVNNNNIDIIILPSK